MSDATEWKRVTTFIQNARNNTGMKDADMRQALGGAFAEPEAYGKITVGDDTGIPGINYAIRKHTDAKDEFNKLFIKRAKKYSDYKDGIKRQGEAIKDAFTKAENMAKQYGLNCRFPT